MQRADVRERRQPPSKEQRRHDRRDDDHVRVFGEEEQREAHAAVFGVKSAGQLLLRLGQIERRAVGFREPADQHEDERERLREDEPDVLVVLRVDDFDHAERAGHQDDADERQRDGDLVRDQLRRRAQAREQRVLAVRRIARQDDAVHADGRHRHDIQQADVDVGDVERNLASEETDRRTERNDRVDDQRRHHRDDRRGGEHPLVGPHRRDVFLDHQLDRIGDRLQDAVRTDAHRSEPRLRPRDDLALEQHHIGDRDERRVQDDDDLEQRDQYLVNHSLLCREAPPPRRVPRSLVRSRGIICSNFPFDGI